MAKPEPWPDVRFGNLDAASVDWRATRAVTDADPDDEELAHTPPDVVAMLGFDPKGDTAKLAKRKGGKSLGPIEQDRTATRHAQASLHVLWRSIFQKQERAARRALLSATKLAKAFSEDQPRDEHGRWTSDGGSESEARQEFHSKLDEEFPRGAVLYHEAPGNIGRKIRNEGVKGDEGVYATIGQPSNFVTGPKTVVRFVVPPSRMHDLAPDQRYDPERPHADLLSQHPNLRGADVAFPDNIPPRWIKEVRHVDAHGGFSFVDKLAKQEGEDDEPDESDIDDAVAGMDLGLTKSQTDELTGTLEDVAADSGGLALAQVGLGDRAGMFEHMSVRARDWAKDHAAELVTNIEETTRDQVKQSVVDGYEENLSVAEIADRIEAIGAFSEDRAALIAQTEVRFANSYGALDGYKEARDNGVQLMKEWLAGPGACEELCQPNADQGPIDLDDTFDSDDDAPPAHPNCRCAISPVVFTAEGESVEGEGESDEEE